VPHVLEPQGEAMAAGPWAWLVMIGAGALWIGKVGSLATWGKAWKRGSVESWSHGVMEEARDEGDEGDEGEEE